MASGATVGSAVVKLEFDGSGVKSSLSGVSKQMESAGKSGGSSFANTWSVVAGNLISKGVSKITSMITAGLEKGIERIDTIKSAEKVIQALGYSAEEAGNTISYMKDYLDGLPTALPDAMQGIQSLTASFGSLDLGTKAFKAVNDAALAFAEDGAAASSSAILQLSQTRLDGPLDAQTWNSLQQNGFQPVFKAMADEAGTTVGALKEYFGHGGGTVQEFLDRLIRLDTEGSASMEALQDVAVKNTTGIGTAITNVKNRIGNAWQKILDYIGQEKISGIINGISSQFSDFADKIIEGLEWIRENWGTIQPIMTGVLAFFGTLLAMGLGVKIATFFATVASSIGLIPALIATVVAIIAVVIANFDKISAWVRENLPFVADMLNAIGSAIGEVAGIIGDAIGIAVGLFNAYVVPAFNEMAKFLGPILEQLFNNISTTVTVIVTVFKVAFTTLWNVIKATIRIVATVFTTVKNIISGVVNAIKNFFAPIGTAFERVFNGIRDVASNIFGAIGGIVKAPINGIISGINGVLRMINSIKVPDWVPGIGGAHTNFGMIPTLAQGGYANGATGAVIGEAGKEVVLPLEQNTDNWAGLLASTLAEQFENEDGVGGFNITIENQNFDIDNAFDAKEAGRLFMQEIRRSA